MPCAAPQQPSAALAQTLRATSATRPSFGRSSSIGSALPSTEVANPHCRQTASRSRGTHRSPSRSVSPGSRVATLPWGTARWSSGCLPISWWCSTSRSSCSSPWAVCSSGAGRGWCDCTCPPSFGPSPSSPSDSPVRSPRLRHSFAGAPVSRDTTAGSSTDTSRASSTPVRSRHWYGRSSPRRFSSGTPACSAGAVVAEPALQTKARPHRRAQRPC